MTARVLPRRTILVLGLCAAAAALLSACGGSGPDTLAGLREAGRVRVGFADEPPYAYLDDGGRLVGSEVAVAATIFGRLGIAELVPVKVAFEDLIPALEDGRVDVIVAGMFITPDRCARVAFSEPTYAAPEVLAVPAGNPRGFTRYRDLREAGGVVGVLAGSVEAQHVRGAGIPDDHIVEAAEPAELVALLSSGAIDAFALTSLSVRSLQAASGGDPFEVTAPFIPLVDGRPAVGAGGFAFRRGDDGLRTAVNAELARLHQEGSLEALVEPYGLGARELVPAASLTANELCAVTP